MNGLMRAAAAAVERAAVISERLNEGGGIDAAGDAVALQRRRVRG
jgi:hypothetical protein